MKTHNRREFISTVASNLIPATGVFAATGALLGCEKQDPDRYSQADIDLLAAQRAIEARQSGLGVHGIQRFQGYRGLAELPWFDLDSKGRLRCTDQSVPMSIDAHCHLGMSVLFKPHLDLSKRSDRVRHLLDCDAQQPGCDLDLDIYVNGNFSEQALDTLEDTMMAQGLWGSSFAETQTIPNLLDEMDAMRVERAVILPIKLGLPFGDDQSEVWRQAIKLNSSQNRLLAGFSIHPRDNDRLQQMRNHAASGARVMKLHPPVQRFYPDDPDMMEVYALAEELGLVVFFHGGRAGIEPESSHPYAMPRHYEAVFAGFPKLSFIIGHAGARDFDAMLKLALKYSNTYMGIHGQSISNLDKMIRSMGGERMLFGTDWPFYHLGSSLAKVLITTQRSGRSAIRRAILRDNALALFEIT